ncbi:MAG: hypothetical protein ACKVXR_11555 [Planctomycetota bacterium]
MQLQRIRVLGAFTLLLAAACGRTEPGPVGSGDQPSATASTSSEAERVASRSAERWKKVAAKDWIAAYDFLPPEERKVLSIVEYLQGKSKHLYENPDVPEVLEVKDDVAFVSVASMWTPTHPALANVKLGPGESLTQYLEMIETWKKTEGQWYYADAMPIREFFVAHPDVPRPAAKTPPTGGALPGTPSSAGG